MNTWQIVDLWRGADWNPLAGIAVEKEIAPGVWKLKRFGITPDAAYRSLPSINTTFSAEEAA